MIKHTLSPATGFHVALALCLVVGGGCARTGSHPPTLPPEAEGGGGFSSEEVAPPAPGPYTVELPENIRLIHRQMMSEAEEHFARQDFNEAIRGLQRLLALHPQQEIEAEGRWMLAQAYQHTGEWEGAREQYRALASAHQLVPHQSEAKQNLLELEKLLEESRRPPQDTQAVRLNFTQLPQSEGFDEGIKRMRGDGVTTLLIDLGCRNSPMEKGDRKGAAGASALKSMQEMIRSFVARSHLQNLRVYIGVAPRCVGFWKEPVPAAWHDRVYDPESKVTREGPFFDVFHPSYQQFLLNFFDQIAESGVDGVIFLGDQPIGIYEGLGESGIKSFQQIFHTRFIPGEVFQQPIDLAQLRNSTPPRQSSSGFSSTQDPLFWRWMGWKARERLVVLEKVFHYLRRRHLTLQVGLEIHPHGLTDPLRALVEYTEDAMEAARRPFTFFYVRPEIDREAASDQKQVVEKLRRISTKAVLSRLLPVVDDPRRVWVSFPADGRKRVAPETGQDAPILGEFPVGIGVVHDLRAFS